MGPVADPPPTPAGNPVRMTPGAPAQHEAAARLAAAGVTPPDVMIGRSLIGVLESEREGLVDPSRDAVVVGRDSLSRRGDGAD